MKPYVERSSAVGGHIPCGQRNFLDRSLFEGTILPEQLGLVATPRTDTPPTAFGTWVHWYTQVSLKAEFKKTDGDFKFTGFDQAAAKATQPSDELWKLACQLFSSESAAQQAMHNAAGLILNRMPAKGANWLAECAGNIPGLLTGHIDLLSDDLEHLVDIKTTGQQPEDGKMKPEHLWQLVAYALLVNHHAGKPPHFASIMYVDRHGDWVCRTKPIDFQSPLGLGLMAELLTWLTFTRDGRYTPTPVFGTHCDTAFCPYRGICRDASVPGGAAIVRRHEPVMVSANPFGATNAS